MTSRPSRKHSFLEQAERAQEERYKAASLRGGRHLRQIQSDVILYLRKHRGIHILSDCIPADVSPSDPQLRNALSANDRIRFNESTDEISYQPVHADIHDVHQLTQFIKQHRNGLNRNDLDDTFPTAKQELDQLVQTQTLLQLYNSETKTHRVFPWDPSPLFKIQVDQEVSQLWCSIQVPSDDMEIERALHSAGLLSGADFEHGFQAQKRLASIATKKRRRRATTGTTKKARQYRITTNAHLKDQYEWLRENGK